MVSYLSGFRKILLTVVKNTVLFSLLLFTACGNSASITKGKPVTIENPDNPIERELTREPTGFGFIFLHCAAKVGVTTNQTGVVTTQDTVRELETNKIVLQPRQHHLVDFLLSKK
jgi:hypothetical protein